MTIVKNCEKCDAPFTTRSISSSRWERLCHICYSERRKANVISNMEDKNERKLTSIENRMITLEEMVNNHIPAIVGAEVNNHIEYHMGQDIVDGIAKRAQDSISDSIQNLIERQIKFEAKIQRQLTTLNNKVLKILKELGD